MDALTLLREVSDTYRNLQSLEIESAIVIESGDDDSSQRSEQRVLFFYAAPDRVRYESCGKNGIFQIADGQQLHTSFGGHHIGGGPRYSSSPMAQVHRLPHLFRRDFPFVGGDEAFLYQDIEEGVTGAEILGDEEGYHVISVSYQPSPYVDLIVSGSAVLFWVNAESRMVIRQQGKVGHRVPTEEEVTWSRHTVSARRVRVNEPLAEETFTLRRLGK